MDAAVGRFMGQREIVERVAVEFLRKVDEMLPVLRHYLEENRFEELERDAHGIKGGAWNLEARRIGDVAALLEGSAKMRDPERCRHYLSAMDPVRSDLAEAVHKFAAGAAG